MEEGKTEKIVLAHNEEIIEAREKYPQVAEKLDEFKVEIRKIVKQIHSEIQDIMEENNQELLSVLVINGIHRMTDEIFL
ncbi:MAG: hypothetical protein KBC30_04220 [Planctomycetes bacterium]|jgi:glutaredoxin|nr:hypothetical protein [Planctomycetota bacterium]HNZ67094.1 hypothetical protein [Planctomycetota bacterium]HPY74592.1 hypothetical protein [Planctomycetota bacterium]HQB00232.1 hypothetical protein [Planctomycetota bacterium]HRU51226.1 hypothetical protein [Planctomycetota bacterium]